MFLNIFSKYIKSGGSGFFSLHYKTNMKTCFIINTCVPCFKTNLTGFSSCTSPPERMLTSKHGRPIL